MAKDDHNNPSDGSFRTAAKITSWFLGRLRSPGGQETLRQEKQSGDLDVKVAQMLEQGAEK